MSKASDKKKREQLGMPYGTACNRLRKQVLFRLLQQQEKDHCYRCGDAIVHIDQLSMEHKIPWLDSDDPEGLFWDLDNIAFSHLSCNSGHRAKIVNRYGEKKVGPKDTSWCCGCQDFLPISCFNSNKERWDGTQDYCRRCQKEMR